MNFKTFFTAVIGLICIFLILSGSFLTSQYKKTFPPESRTTISIVVEEKTVEAYEDFSVYKVFVLNRTTQEKEVLTNIDDPIQGKYNSSEIYQELKVGNIYTVEVIGKRVPKWDLYRNILKITSSY